jgi:hypothetical protein
MRVPVLISTALLAIVPVLAASQPQDPADKGQADKSKKPSLTLKATPPISFSPATIRVAAQLVGGPDDYEELYCPTVEWDWGDGTTSESTADCEPYQPGISKILRRFSTSHVYNYPDQTRFRIQVRLKRDTKVILSGSTSIQVRPGVRDMNPY